MEKFEDFNVIKDYFLDLKQSTFYLSYAEELYLNYILDKKVPVDILLAGIQKCMHRFPIFKRRKVQLFMCHKDIEAYITDFLKKMWSDSNEHWYMARYNLHIERIKNLGLDKEYHLDLENTVPPNTEEEASYILNNIKKKIFEKEWERLSEPQKKEILSKFEKFKDIKELYEKIIMDHLLHKLNLHWIDLYSL